MDKYDLELLLKKGKAKANITRTHINRKLEDTSFSTVFGKQLAIHCSVAVICIIILCVVLSSLLSLNCRNDMNEMITNAAMNLVKIKSQDLSITQDTAKTQKEMLGVSIEANQNGFIQDSVCVLYNITNQSVAHYTALGIQSQSDRLNDWYQEQTGDLTAEPVFNLPETLREFAQTHTDKTLVMTSVRLVNNVLTPEVVEARIGKRLIDTWTENVGQDPNRVLFNDDCPILIAGTPTDSWLLGIIESHQFISDAKNHNVSYNKSQWPNNIRIATKQFSVDNTDYEVSLLYSYAGLQPIMWFIILSGIAIVGVAIIVSLTQTKKIREF